MTAVSVLTRVLPFLLESYTDSDTEEVDPDLERMFWSTEALRSSGGGGDDEVRIHNVHTVTLCAVRCIIGGNMSSTYSMPGRKIRIAAFLFLLHSFYLPGIESTRKKERQHSTNLPSEGQMMKLIIIVRVLDELKT